MVQIARDDSVTAVLCANDQVALGLIRALAEHGRRVPEDVSVVGFDDIPEAAYFLPPLTTVRQPLSERGQVAAQMLGELIEGVQPRTRRVELATELIVRESTTAKPT